MTMHMWLWGEMTVNKRKCCDLGYGFLTLKFKDFRNEINLHSLDDDGNSSGLNGLGDGHGNLFGQPLLDLQPAGEDLDDSVFARGDESKFCY